MHFLSFEINSGAPKTPDRKVVGPGLLDMDFRCHADDANGISRHVNPVFRKKRLGGGFTGFEEIRRESFLFKKLRRINRADHFPNSFLLRKEKVAKSETVDLGKDVFIADHFRAFNAMVDDIEDGRG